MSGVEIGVIRAEIGFDFAVLGDVYAFGRRDFEGFNELDIPRLVVYNQKGSDHGVVFLDEGSFEPQRKEQIEDGRFLYYDPQGRLSEIEFRGISRVAVVDEKIPLSPDEVQYLDRIPLSRKFVKNLTRA